MDGTRFDAAIKRLVTGDASRRQFISRAVAIGAGGLPLVGANVAAAQRHKHHHKRHKPLRCDGDSCDGTGGKACGSRGDCQCYRWSKGGNVCASARSSSCDATCNVDRDCPKGAVCVEGGPACCGRGVKFCKPACLR